ncbi:tRNA (guanosine(37)-N1)-methyltransferase TrmD [Candidatus Azambacteria bacterium]|nr:tRNA (guanosine(37)-N1)-methyltransferase TrmD [Candidatus Azambacteria bacterium]
MRFDIITVFPEIFDSYFGASIIRRAQQKKLVEIHAHNLRDFALDKHKKVDDRPYGGGAGMVLLAEPLLRAMAFVTKKIGRKKCKVVILSAKGKQFTQAMAYTWAKKYKNIVFITGRYEGIDERVKKALRAEEVSIGPYVLTDGDVAVMTIVSSVARLVPGVIAFESLQEESHWNTLLKREKGTDTKETGLEYPHYTRPEVLIYGGKKYRVPKVLLSGDHKKIEEWRKRQRIH